MTGEQIGDGIRAASAVATAIAAWFAAIVAYRGLGRWRSETRGRRQAELAATVLASVYEFADILNAARQRWAAPHELAPLQGIPNEISAKAAFIPERRLMQHETFFGRFRSLKHEYAAVFGKEAANTFDELWQVRLDINHAVDDMLRNEELGRSHRPEDRQEWQRMYNIAYRHPDPANDEIAKRIANAVHAAEAICRPAIEAQAKG